MTYDPMVTGSVLLVLLDAQTWLSAACPAKKCDQVLQSLGRRTIVPSPFVCQATSSLQSFLSVDLWPTRNTEVNVDIEILINILA